MKEINYLTEIECARDENERFALISKYFPEIKKCLKELDSVRKEARKEKDISKIEKKIIKRNSGYCKKADYINNKDRTFAVYLVDNSYRPFKRKLCVGNGKGVYGAFADALYNLYREEDIDEIVHKATTTDDLFVDDWLGNYDYDYFYLKYKNKYLIVFWKDEEEE